MRAGSLSDRCTEYAQAVVSGDIVAGPYVRGACQRHLNDLGKDPAIFPFYYDKAAANYAISFFEECLCLNGGQFEGQPFILLPWQCFVVGSIFGWKRKDNNMRRFRVAYIETPKGSGKSPLAAGIGLIGLCADKEQRAEVYAAATYKEQAMVLFRDAVAFFDQSPELQKRLIASGTGDKRWKLSHKASNSFFKVISSEKKGQSGPRPHIALLDEVHEHPDGTVIEMIRAGFKFRRQPLSCMITNSGHDKTTVCWEYHDAGSKIACELIENDEFFAYICSLDEADLLDDRYLEDESLWVKVNPSLDAGIPGYDYIRGQITEAHGVPSKMATVKRLCFCVWTEAENPWISGEIWNACRDSDFDTDLLVGRRCYGGLDLSAVNDLSSLNFIFEETPEDPVKRLKPHFWIPGEGIRRKSEVDHVPYDVWAKEGHLFTSKGNTISKSQIVKFLHECSQRYDIQGVAFDRDRIKDLLEFANEADIELSIGEWNKKEKKWEFSGDGIKMMPFGQSARSMAPAVDKFEAMLLEKELLQDGNPVQTWCVANAVAVADDDGNRKISKRKSTGRVDGAVTAIMAAGIMADSAQPQRSAYEGMSDEEIKDNLMTF